ncbi:MAG TPA: DUF6259 domain-containing protein [Verrucomicrobiota bacterium]|nr:DUF6259 domain-containing protein [Verrucomicrobiota bacterium]
MKSPSQSAQTQGHPSPRRPQTPNRLSPGKPPVFSRNRFARSLLAAVAFAALPGFQSAHGAQDSFQIANGSLRVAVDPIQGRLAELIDIRSGVNWISRDTDLAALWQIEGVSHGRTQLLSPSAAQSFRCEPAVGRSPGLRLTWEQFSHPAPAELRVEVVIRLDEQQSLSRWRIRVQCPPDWSLTTVRFPRVAALVRQPNERLAVPSWMGQETAEPRQVLAGGNRRGTRLVYPYPGLLSLQCMAFYARPGAGLYVACDDVASFRKDFVCYGDSQENIGFELAHLPEQTGPAGGGWELPYQVVLGVFQGDWLTAAECYRAWATNQSWAVESRLARGQVPDWVLETGLWVWNRGRSDQVFEPAAVLRKKLGLPVSVFWHWWHGCAYDTGFPEYLPPREGTEAFQRALRQAHRRDLHALVYMNQRLWGMTTRSWTNEGAARFAVKGPDGQIHPEVYNTFTREPCASMCMGTEFWRGHYAGLAEQAVRQLGVDGIYMDQACTSLACYDPSHGHPLGGGTYWMNGFKLLAADIRQRCLTSPPSTGRQGGSPPGPRRSAPPALAGEGCGESWLPYLDLMLSLQVSRERYAAPDGWETIPFFHAVYHNYVITYGNYSSLTMPPYDELWPARFAPAEPLRLLDRKFSRQFCLEQARAFVWGQQPTVANFLPAHLEQRAEEIAYVLQLARLRSRAVPYLRDGVFLRPPELRAPEATLDMSRLSIYAGQQGGLTTFQKKEPLALAAAWRAPHGAVAVALASIAGEPLELELELKPNEWGLAERARIYRLEAAGRKRLGRLARGMTALPVRLPARGACLIEFVPD